MPEVEATEVGVLSVPCPNGHDTPSHDPVTKLINVHCPTCGGSMITFGEPKKVKMQLEIVDG